MDEPVFTRRMLLQRGCMLASALATVPGFIERSALAMTPEASSLSSLPGVPQDRVLVVIQLAGGNDGLNTVVPYGDPNYYRLRPRLALSVPGSNDTRRMGAALELAPDLGLGMHAGLAGFKELYDDGLLSIVQGVGYPNPNRSHFTSQEIWESGGMTNRTSGWLGRYFDCTCNGSPQADAAVATGRSAPLALQGALQVPTCLDGTKHLGWAGEFAGGNRLKSDRNSLLDAVSASRTSGDSQRSFLTRSVLDANVSSERIVRAASRSPLVAYPGDGLGAQLRTIGAMIRDGFPTRVYYASLAGFDTHNAQAWNHGSLLESLGKAVSAFQRDLRAQGNDGRVLTLVFSEFGRRVRENAGAGTDHGAAAPVFLVGPNARPGIHGAHPSLLDLDEGDLRHSTDFRAIYASILEDWLRAPSAQVLEGAFPNARVVRTT